jgi:hypothetical protein
VSVAAERKLITISKTFVYSVWGCYVLANLLGGFKGGMVNVVVLMLLVASVSGRPISLRQILRGKRILLVVGALLFGVLLSFAYKSQGVESFRQSLVYLSSRATVMAAEPGYVAMHEFGTQGTGGDQIAGDFHYFTQKYFSFMNPGQDAPFTFEKTVSSIMYQTPLSEGYFVVPVTVGAFPELCVNFGVAGAMAAMSIVGLLFSYLFVRSQTCSDVLGTAVYALGLQMMQVYITNGGLMYALFNFALMSILLACLYFASEQVAGFELRGTASGHHGKN